jgi:hypothetical protein
MGLPKIIEVTLRPVMSSAFHTVHMLDAISMKSERLSLTKLDSVEFAYLREGLDQYYASLELVRSFSRILSVERISDDLIGSQADEIQLTPAPLPCHSNLNGLTFLNSSIDPIYIRVSLRYPEPRATLLRAGPQVSRATGLRRLLDPNSPNVQCKIYPEISEHLGPQSCTGLHGKC